MVFVGSTSKTSHGFCPHCFVALPGHLPVHVRVCTVVAPPPQLTGHVPHAPQLEAGVLESLFTFSSHPDASFHPVYGSPLLVTHAEVAGFHE
jgi:hypothetical protein